MEGPKSENVRIAVVGDEVGHPIMSFEWGDLIFADECATNVIVTVARSP